MSAVQRAQLLIDTGRHAQAAQELGRHLAVSPDDAYALALLAQAQLGAGELQAALTAAGRAVALAPQWEWPHRIASVVLLRLGRAQEAERAAREAVRLEPDEWQTHAQLARVLAQPLVADGQPFDRSDPRRGVPRAEQAWQAACTAVALAPLEPGAHCVVGDVALAGMHLDQAEQAYRRVLQLDPADAQAVHDLALVRERRGQLTSAAGGFAAAVAADPRDPTGAHNVLVVGWRLLRRLQLVLGVVAFFAVFLGGNPDAGDDGVPPSVGGPLVLVVLGVVALAGVATLRRLPAQVRAVLWRRARGDGRAATATTAAGALLLVVAPWLGDPQVRSGAAVTALLVLALGFFVLSLRGLRRLHEEHDRRA